MKIVADDKIPFIKEGLAKFAGLADFVLLPGGKIVKSDLVDADALITRTRTKCDVSLMEGTGVKFIASATIGFDHIDTQFCESHGIYWTNAPGCNSSSVAQYFASTVLRLAKERKLSLNDIKLGIVGVGNVGSKIAKFAEIAGMKILLNDPPRARKEENGRFVEIERIQDEADIITFHVPLIHEGSDKTFHLADESFFRKIRKNVIFINSSRGEAVDTAALKNAIAVGKVTDAVIDVWENEPGIDLELLRIAKFATPHIAGYSTDGKANGTSMCVNALNRFFGFGLAEWRPGELPGPKNPVFEIDCSDKSGQEVLFEAVNNSYDITWDDLILRGSPATFEKQRGDYPVRREFPAFSIKLINDVENFAGLLVSAGFNVQH